MRHHNQLVRGLLTAALLSTSVIVGGCGSSRGGYGGYYDPYYGDYRHWDRTELGLYHRWEGETRRSHIDFDRRAAAEQHEFMTWRRGR